MRYLELTIRRPSDQRHPMHQFVAEHDDYEVTRQLFRHQYAADEQAMLFHVEGPVDPYGDAIADVRSMIEFEITPCSDDSFYLYVRERISEEGRELIEAFSQPGLILSTPVEYRSDGTVRLGVVGPTDAIQAAADEVADENETEILEVGEFRSSRIDARIGVTRRQFEAVSVAVDCGYYEVPRRAALEDVAARLECSTGTAGELLRRAERKVMSDLVVRGPFK